MLAYTKHRSTSIYKEIFTDQKGEINSNVMILRNVSISLSKMEDRPNRKTNKELLNLNYTPEQMDLTDIIEHSIKY